MLQRYEAEAAINLLKKVSLLDNVEENIRDESAPHY